MLLGAEGFSWDIGGCGFEQVLIIMGGEEIGFKDGGGLEDRGDGRVRDEFDENVEFWSGIEVDVLLLTVLFSRSFPEISELSSSSSSDKSDSSKFLLN